MATWLGIDVGGTFTDLVAVDLESQTAGVAKVATTLPDQSAGILNAIDASGVDLADVEVIVHGTTTATNAVLENNAAPTGLITTRGFRDVLELGRRTRPNLYGLGGSFRALVPRVRRLEVDERLTSHGDVHVPLDEAQVRAAARQLREAECESVAICFINSYVDPRHERRAAELVKDEWPEAHVTQSAEVLPQIREFERTTTAVLNATLQPLITRYVDRLLVRLEERGYHGSLYVVQANGGVMLAGVAGKRAVHTVLSGPAAGVTAAARIGIVAGYPNIISGDVGGTSFDVAMIRDGAAMISEDRDLGFRLPLRVPAVDMISIGAGGGSIARVDRAGLLRVGPESAGSYPGPVCYGRGGTLPTLTDANLWLGRLDTSRIAGLDTSRDLGTVGGAIAEYVARPLGISVDEAAVAIVQIANSSMASAIRLVSIERGIDPRDFAYVSFGGAGPLHATALADEIGIPTVILPARPGVTSALGCLVADVRLDRLRSVTGPAAQLDLDALGALMDELEADIRQEIAGSVLGNRPIRIGYTLQMHYDGQFHVIPVQFEERPTDRADVEARFEQTYKHLYGGILPSDRGIRIYNVGISAVSPRAEIDLSLLRSSQQGTGKERRRRAWFGGGWMEVPVVARGELGDATDLPGPLIVEQEDSTLIIEDGWSTSVDASGNLICRHTKVDS